MARLPSSTSRIAYAKKEKSEKSLSLEVIVHKCCNTPRSIMLCTSKKETNVPNKIPSKGKIKRSWTEHSWLYITTWIVRNKRIWKIKNTKKVLAYHSGFWRFLGVSKSSLTPWKEKEKKLWWFLFLCCVWLLCSSSSSILELYRFYSFGLLQLWFTPNIIKLGSSQFLSAIFISVLSFSTLWSKMALIARAELLEDHRKMEWKGREGT